MNTFLSGDVKVDLTITQPTFATKQSWRGITSRNIKRCYRFQHVCPLVCQENNKWFCRHVL